MRGRRLNASLLLLYFLENKSREIDSRSESVRSLGSECKLLQPAAADKRTLNLHLLDQAEKGDCVFSTPLGSVDGASSCARIAANEQSGRESQQAARAALQNHRGVSTSLDGYSIRQAVDRLFASEALHRLPRKQKTPEREVSPGSCRSETSVPKLAT